MIWLLAAVTLLLYTVVILSIIIFILWWLSIAQASKRAAPFVPSDQWFLDEVVAALNLKSDSVLYDLGSGDGRVLAAAYKTEPRAKYIGIEKSLFPYLLGTFRLGRMKDADITVLKQNIFSVDLSQATHVYAFLLPDIMDALGPKFEEELRPGTKVLSLQFPILDWNPERLIEVPYPRQFKKSRKLYVYTL